MPSLSDFYGDTGPGEGDLTPGEAVAASGKLQQPGPHTALMWVAIVAVLVVIRLLYEWGEKAD